MKGNIQQHSYGYLDLIRKDPKDRTYEPIIATYIPMDKLNEGEMVNTIYDFTKDIYYNVYVRLGEDGRICIMVNQSVVDEDTRPFEPLDVSNDDDE